MPKERCDRCGNDFDKGRYALHLPYVNDYIYFCNICWTGIMFSLYRDAKREIEK